MKWSMKGRNGILDYGFYKLNPGAGEMVEEVKCGLVKLKEIINVRNQKTI